MISHTLYCFRLGSTCNHVAAILFKVEHAATTGLSSCTSHEAQWTGPASKRKGALTPKRVSEMVIKKPHYSHFGKNTDINPTVRKEFNPVSQSTAPSLNQIANAMYHCSKNTCAFQYVGLRQCDNVPPEHDSNVEITLNVQTSEGVPLELHKTIALTNPKNSSEIPTLNPDQIEAINFATRGQHKNESWRQHRRGRITASNAHSVKTRVESITKGGTRSTDVTPLLEKLCSRAKEFTKPQLKYGRHLEGEARVKFLSELRKTHKGVTIVETGLIVHSQYIFIAGSPDGIIKCQCCPTRVLEIKCPWKCCGKDPKEYKADFFRRASGQNTLKQNHEFYTQIQFQMAVTGTESGFFVVYSRKGIFYEEVKFNPNYFKYVVKLCEYFFNKYIIPHFRTVESDQKVGSYTVATSENTKVPSKRSYPIQVPCKKFVRKRRKVLESLPFYMCGVCQIECMPVEQIASPCDESVQCDACRNWFHIVCVAYRNEKSWLCNNCVLLV